MLIQLTSAVANVQLAIISLILYVKLHNKKVNCLQIDTVHNFLQAQTLTLVNIHLAHHYSALNVNIHDTRNRNTV